MADKINLAIKDNTFNETYLDDQLFQQFQTLDIEEQHGLLEICISKAYKKVLINRHIETQKAMLDLGVKPDGSMLSKDELWEKFHLLKVEMLFLQDMLSFLDKVKAHLIETVPGLIRDETQQQES